MHEKNTPLLAVSLRQLTQTFLPSPVRPLFVSASSGPSLIEKTHVEEAVLHVDIVDDFRIPWIRRHERTAVEDVLRGYRGVVDG